MNTSKKTWSLPTTHGLRKRIDTNPDYQRPAVWTRSQKQLLIDTILRGYDIPKLYWRRTGKKPATYEVIDGQQRLRAVWEFMDGDFRLPKDADSVSDQAVEGCAYDDLPEELRVDFDTYSLDLIIVDDADEEEVREMFLRLQNGTTLRAQEKRNAYPGRMRNFVRSLASHQFFESVAFKNTRYTHDLVAAQLVCIELVGGPTNVKNRDLNNMYRKNQKFDAQSKAAKSVRRRLNLMRQVFPEKTPELTRYNTVALYCVFAELQESYVSEEFVGVLGSWFLDFERRRGEQDKLSEDEADAGWVSYKEKISHSTDAESSIRERTDFLMRDLLTRHDGLTLKDKQRGFTSHQRLAVFRRDRGTCQVQLRCEGATVKWDRWHCDHRIPWSAGGPTTVANGQVSCVPCNLTKGAANG